MSQVMTDHLRLSQPARMTLTWSGERQAKVIAENPDPELLEYMAQQFRLAYEKEIQAFLQEIAVELRRLKPGETKQLESRPITATLSAAADDQKQFGVAVPAGRSDAQTPED